ncbi:MAG: hypothetical protein JNJ73_17475 [Hyphomonadaceae bacterium]|nr:hypothetical protein [Hyphomonadaceae bacterium]
MRVLMSAAVAAIALTASAAAETPYQPRDGARGYGYSETQLEPSRVRVTFRGDTRTERETVVQSMLYRAAQLTLQSGFDYYVVVAGNVEEDTRFDQVGFARPRFGGADYRERTSHTAVADIAMYKGARPLGALNAYDAHEVQRNLAPRMVQARN